MKFYEFTGSLVECSQCHAAVPVSAMTRHAEWHNNLDTISERAELACAPTSATR